jgi:alkanesulfonate monooxygenase SsuD/methylene tetrahydromethanopterin reductase-like flavin-dependent oxidoreductase (luciferase family)
LTPARGIGLFAGTPPDIVGETARLGEELGYDSFWVNHPGETDGLVALGVAAGSTTAIALGIGVIPLHVRAAESVVAGVRSQRLPTERLLLGIGSANAGAFALAREGVALIRAELGCRVVMGALGEPACRLAGAIADGVLFNWLTPEHARLSAGWVEAGAAAAGRPRPRLYAYVRFALGADARERVVEEGKRYGRGHYATHFERMGVDPIETAIAVADAAQLESQLRPWDGAVDEIVLRLLPTASTLEAHLELVRAGAA